MSPMYMDTPYSMRLADSGMSTWDFRIKRSKMLSMRSFLSCRTTRRSGARPTQLRWSYLPFYATGSSRNADSHAYLDCCEQLKLAPVDCVFVDDQRKNIAGAIAVGMKTVHFDVTHPGGSYRKALALLNQ